MTAREHPEWMYSYSGDARAAKIRELEAELLTLRAAYIAQSKRLKKYERKKQKP